MKDSDSSRNSATTDTDTASARAAGSSPITDDELHAWVDGRLDRDRKQAFESRLAQDPAAREAADAWSVQREQLRSMLGSSVADHPVPPALLAAARSADAVHSRAARAWRLAAIAASLLVAFTAGWVGHGAWRIAPGQGQELARNFAHDAAVAHVVYTPEVRHPVEVGAAQQEHLVQWLSKRLGRQLKVPMLQPRGFELVGGRLLPGEGGARAQFMFQNGTGTRLTLYIGAVNVEERNKDRGKPSGASTNADSKAVAGETAFRFMQDGGVPRFYWVDEGTGYALSGDLPRPALLDVADDVYQQLGGDGRKPAAVISPASPAAR